MGSFTTGPDSRKLGGRLEDSLVRYTKPNAPLGMAGERITRNQSLEAPTEPGNLNRCLCAFSASRRPPAPRPPPPFPAAVCLFPPPPRFAPRLPLLCRALRPRLSFRAGGGIFPVPRCFSKQKRPGGGEPRTRCSGSIPARALRTRLPFFGRPRRQDVQDRPAPRGRTGRRGPEGNSKFSRETGLPGYHRPNRWNPQ